MLNQYGDRPLVAVRVPLNEIVENVITGRMLPAGSVTGGVSTNATFVDMVLYGTASEPVAGVILVFEDESQPLCVNGVLIPEVSAAIAVQQAAPLSRAVEDVVHAAEEVTAEQPPTEPAE